MSVSYVEMSDESEIYCLSEPMVIRSVIMSNVGTSRVSVICELVTGIEIFSHCLFFFLPGINVHRIIRNLKKMFATELKNKVLL